MEFSRDRLKNYKWPVSICRTIEASPGRIWSTISTPGILEKCHPFCEKNPVHKWPGVGARDEIHYYSGWVLHREFVNWIEGVGYDLIIGRERGAKSFVSWRITEMRDEAGKLAITIYPHIFQNLPVAIRWIPYLVEIQPQLRNYLRSVLRGLELCVLTGRPVRKNQFGSHKWFSPANT